MPHSPVWRCRNSSNCAVSPTFGAAARCRFGRWKLDEKHRRVVHAQRAQDVVAGARIGGRGQRDARHAGKHAPADRRARDIPGGTRGPIGETQCASSIANSASLQPRQPIERAVAQQPLRRDVEQVQLLLDQVARDRLRASAGIELGVQRAGGDTDLAQRRDLVVHQRDQRRDDHRGAGAAQRGHLVADALAAAGRHQHQRVATGQHVLDRRLPARRESPGKPNTRRSTSAGSCPDRRAGSSCMGSANIPALDTPAPMHRAAESPMAVPL